MCGKLAQLSVHTQAVQGRRRKEDLVSILCFRLVNETHRVRAVVGLEGPTVAHATEQAEHHATKLASSSISLERDVAMLRRADWERERATGQSTCQGSVRS